MNSYKKAGVDIDLGEQFIRQIKSITASTHTQGTLTNIGSFAGSFEIDLSKWHDPVLTACTDGVGTKLKLAFEMDNHNTIGIDLVAMSINDLLVTGAEPLFFLDYLATSKLDPSVHVNVIQGIAEGCKLANCSLLGGETAEMPDMYAAGEYDLAGFAVGITNKQSIWSKNKVKPGDYLLGIPSSGLHSNGYSLVRKLFKNRKQFPLNQIFPPCKRTLGDLLLEPTRIYSNVIKILKTTNGIRSIAHITGGGITGNVPRILPNKSGAVFFEDSWPIHPVFKLIQTTGDISKEEMFHVFNMGLGLIVACNRNEIHTIQEQLQGKGYSSYHVGCVTTESGVKYTQDKPKQMPKPVPPDKSRKIRLAIIGSGRGSNMDSICKAIDNGQLHAEVACVISNNSKAFMLERGRRRDIPIFHLSSFTHKHPDDLLSAFLDIFKKTHVDMICLAGYMKKIPPEFIQAYPGRILNIHPALLPSFGGKGMYGMKVHESVIKSGAKFSGASIHIVDEEYDRGRIVAQDIVPVHPDDTPELLAERVLKIEHALYWRAIEQVRKDLD